MRLLLEGLKLTRRGGSIWVEHVDGGPVDPNSCSLLSGIIANEDPDGFVIAQGPKEKLEQIDAALKIVAGGEMAIAICGNCSSAAFGGLELDHRPADSSPGPGHPSPPRTPGGAAA